MVLPFAKHATLCIRHLLFEASVFSSVEKTTIAIAAHGVTRGIKRHNTNKTLNAVSLGDCATQRLVICQEARSDMNTTTSQQDDGEGISGHPNWCARSAGNGEVIRNTFGVYSVTGYTKVWKR